MIVFPVRIIMSPTSSSRLFAGRNARSATPLTIYLPICGRASCASAAIGAEAYAVGCDSANGRRRRNWRSICPLRVLLEPMRYIRPRMTGSHLRRRSWPTAAALASVLLATGCGGSPRQDADEPKGSYKLEVAGAQFPASQSIAESATMSIRVRNADSKPAPNVAVTVETAAGTPGEGTAAFGQRGDDPRLSDPERPVWIVDAGPKGGDSAATNTWALGPLKAGQTKEFRWKVTAVEPGSYTIRYRIAPGLQGKARLARGGRTDGAFRVQIQDKPVPARVDDNGNVVRGERPGASK